MSFSITNEMRTSSNALTNNLLQASNKSVTSAYGHEVVKIGETAVSKSYWYTTIKIIVLALIAVSLIAFIYLTRKRNQGSAVPSSNINFTAPAPIAHHPAPASITNHPVPAPTTPIAHHPAPASITNHPVPAPTTPIAHHPAPAPITNHPVPAPIENHPAPAPPAPTAPIVNCPARAKKSTSVTPTHHIPNFPPHWNAAYITRIPEEGTYQDPIFTLLSDVNVREFGSVVSRWSQLEWFMNLNENTKNDFRLFIFNINSQLIPRQKEVFRDYTDANKAYNLYKKGIIYLFNKVKDNPNLGEMIVLQLNNVVHECPLSYLSSINIALDTVTEEIDLSGGTEDNFMKGIHHLYGMRRKEIVNEMAANFGRRETHTPNSLLSLIGQARNIPGYKMTVGDKQADLFDHQRRDLIDAFDAQNKPHNIINWFYRKINGLDNGRYHLQLEIAEYLRDHFDVEIDVVREVIYDEGFFVKVEVVAACLELSGVITPRQRTKSALVYLDGLLLGGLN